MITRSALPAGNKDSSENRRLADLEAAALLRMSNTMALDANTEIAISAVAAEMCLTRLEVIRLAIREWLATRESTRFPADDNAICKSVAPVRSDIPE